jgi:hypothetical protein
MTPSLEARMNDELWKERLGFVSGTILAWGIVLVHFWPSVAIFQTGRHLRAWSMNTPGQGVRTDVWMFWLLTALLAVGAWTVFLAVVHILSRGLWMMVALEEKRGAGAMPLKNPLDKLSSLTYAAVFLQWFAVALLLVVVPLVLLSAGFEQLLAHIMPMQVAGWIARIAVAIINVIVTLFVVYRAFTTLPRLISVEDIVILNAIYLVVVFGFMISWLVVIEFCNTVSLTVDSKVVRPDHGVTVTVALGGATSDPREAQLQLVDAKNNVLPSPPLYDTGEGSYLSYIPPSLSPGLYRVVLRYPHTSFTSSFPFVRGRTERSQTFLVAP